MGKYDPAAQAVQEVPPEGIISAIRRWIPHWQTTHRDATESKKAGQLDTKICCRKLNGSLNKGGTQNEVMKLQHRV
jgi:hypothetical protein